MGRKFRRGKGTQKAKPVAPPISCENAGNGDAGQEQMMTEVGQEHLMTKAGQEQMMTGTDDDRSWSGTDDDRSW